MRAIRRHDLIGTDRLSEVETAGVFGLIQFACWDSRGDKFLLDFLVFGDCGTVIIFVISRYIDLIIELRGAILNNGLRLR